MNWLTRLLGLDRRKRRRRPNIDRAMGPWQPYPGGNCLPRTRLPRTVDVPDEAVEWGHQPGPMPFDQALFDYWLRINPTTVGYLLMKLRQGHLYRRIELPREGKPSRLIDAPEPGLKRVQQLLLERLLNQMEVHPAAHGFVPGRSIFTSAAPHTGKRLVVCLDLRDFFPSIIFARVTGLFKSYGFSEKRALQLAGLCCFEGRLPQGAPTSPMLSNLVCRRLDARLAGLMGRHACAYTRYADDLTFSGDEGLLKLLPMVRRIVAEEGFALADEKTRIQRSGSRQMVTGLTVNHAVAVPRKVRRLLRAMVHNQVYSAASDDGLIAFLYGHLAFMQPAHPEQAHRLRRKLDTA